MQKSSVEHGRCGPEPHAVSLWMLQLALPAWPASIGTTVLLALLLGVIVAIYMYATRHFSYWQSNGVPFVRPLPFAGNLKDVLLFRKHIFEVLHEQYNKMKGLPYVGMFFFDQRVLFVKDVSLWKNMMHKDWEHFQDRGFSPLKSDHIFSETLFARKGKYWKDLRMKLNPAFTSGKLKRFFVLLEQKASHLNHFFDDAVKEGTPRDVMDVCVRYNMDAVASVGFGIESAAITDDNDPLYRLLRSVFVYNKIYTLASIATFVDMPLLSWLKVSLLPAPLAAYLRSAIWQVAEQRLRAGLQGARGDFLDLLLELRAKGRIAGDDEALPAGPNANANPALDAKAPAIDMDGDVLIAQAFSVMSSGFNSTAITMSFALYHLAKDEVMQEKLRTELQKAVNDHGGILTYEALQSVSYLDMIFSETLRLYPVLPFLDRTCTKTYRIPGTNHVIDKGVFAFTSTMSIQRDPEYFPNPECFDPERFSEANKVNIPSGCYSPFGDGPRQCIGLRLAYLQVKLGLAHIILNYRVLRCAETPSKMEFNLHSFLISPRDGVPLKFVHVEK